MITNMTNSHRTQCIGVQQAHLKGTYYINSKITIYKTTFLDLLCIYLVAVHSTLCFTVDRYFVQYRLMTKLTFQQCTCLLQHSKINKTIFSYYRINFKAV